MTPTLQAAAAHYRAGRLPEAEQAYREALDSDPGNPEVLHILGAVVFARGDYDTAADLIGQAVAAAPRAPDYHYNLGNVERARGRADAAIAAYRAALAIEPDYRAARENLIAALINAGAAFRARGETEAAKVAFEEALAVDPNFYPALKNLALMHSLLERFDKSFAVYERALAAHPERLELWRNLLPAIVYHPGLDNAERFAWHARFAAAARAVAGAPAAPAFKGARDPDRRLRIGWLSSDFRAHSVARNLEPLLLNRSRATFEAYFYSDVAAPDEVSEGLYRLGDVVRSVRGMDDAQAADLIRADGVDILIIIAGHFDDNRPQLALHRAAPVQISLYDCATSGFAEIDYMLVDPYVAPRRTTERFAERLLRTPSFYIYAPFDAAPPVRDDGPPRFACFGAPSKISRRSIALWAEILNRLPDWGLTLKYSDAYDAPELRARMSAAFAAHGVAEGRLEFHTRRDHGSRHLLAYNRVDVVLDTNPFNAATGTFEALWMGVPVVTLPGEAMAGRWAASILSVAGRRDGIADSPQDYVARAVRLAGRRDELARDRGKLREAVAASLLCDGPRATRHLERALRATWRRYCAGYGPERRPRA